MMLPDPWMRLERNPNSDAEHQGENRVLLIGAENMGILVAEYLCTDPHLQLVGFLDDDNMKAGSVIAGLPVLGRIDLLPSVVERHRVNQVVVCI